MWDYQALLVLHILCIVFWLGPDGAAYYVIWLVRKPRLEPKVRFGVARVLFFLDQMSRTSTIILIATGVGLMRLGGWGLQDVPVELLWLAVSILLLWCVGSVWITGFRHDWTGVKSFHLAEQFIRSGIAIVALIILATSIGDGDTVQTTWLIVKVTLFGVIMIESILAFMMPNPFRILADIAATGSTQELEARFRSTQDALTTIIASISVMLVTMIIIAVIRI